MRLLRIMLSLLVLLLCGAAAKAQFDPANPPEPGVNFTLTTRCIPEDGGYNLTSSGTQAFGSSVHLSVSQSTGYRFVGWEDEEGNSLTTSLSFYYTMPSHDVTLTARFVYDPSDPTEPSTPVFKDEANINFVTNPADGGYFLSNYNGTYTVGSNQNFTARANSGYRFINWTRDDEVIGTSTSLEYTVPNGDHTLVANFEFDPSSPSEPGNPHFYRQLTLVSNPQNAATLRGGGTYLDGTSQYLSMTINDYYHFVNWTDENGAVVSESSGFYYTMPNRNVTLTANFTYNYDPNSPTEPGPPNPDGSVTTDMVARPRFGMYDDTHVMILCETQGSTIHYTLDGTDPTTESPVYTDPVFVGSNLLVKAFAVKEGMDNSPIISYQVTAYRTGVPVYIFENKMVKITSSTPDAVIRYTLDFTEPTAESPIYTTPFLPEENCRIKAYASKEGLTDSPVSIYVYRRAEHTMQAPTFSLNDEEKLVITSPIANGVIRYTLDGTEPNESSTLYSGPITLTQNGTVKAYVTHINYFDSPSASYEVTTFTALAPVISFTNKKVTITSATENAVIRYTLDGTEPTAESLLYTEPFLPANSCTVTAFASKENFNASTFTSYVFNRAEHTATAPTFAIDGEGKLVITPTVEGGVTRYTMDGNEPTTESPAYSAPITLTQNCTVRAYTSHTELLDSPVASYEVNTFVCEAPVINFHAKMVEMSCVSENAVIRYTLDGTEPTAESPVYEAPFLPTADCTIKAFASKANFNNSPVTNYVYNRAEHTATAPTFAIDGEGKLVITATVEGGVTRYSMDGTEPTAESPAYSAPITLTQNCTVKAYTTHAELLDSPVASYEVNTFVCEAPIVTFRAKMVEMSCASENAVIRYTLDGTEPTAESPVYEAPFLPANDCTIKAFASKANFNDSPVTSYGYNRAEHTATAPTFAIDGEGKLVITATVEGGVTRYSMDGTEPTAESPTYSAPITLTQNCTVKAYTSHTELLDSPVASYEVNTFVCEAPVINFHAKMVEMSCVSENAVIRYTLDGTEPTAESPVYEAPFLPTADCTIKAFASKANFNNSPVTNYVYNRAEHTAPAPTFALNDAGQLVIIPSVNGGRTYYTMDGGKVSRSYNLYNGPITLTQNCIVEAYTTHAELLDSPVASYEVNTFYTEAPVITFENRKINIVCPSANSVIRYTLDGSEPNATSQVYSVPFVPENDCEIKAYASKANFNDSPVSNYVYNRAEHTATAPVFHLVAGSELVQMFALEPTMENCIIHYTTDGTEPNASSQLYTEPFPVQEDGVVMAIAIRDNYFDSPVEEFNIAEHKEVAPILIPNYFERVIEVGQADETEVALLINGELADIQAAPFTFEVVPGMTEVSAIALGKAEDRVHSLPQTMPIEFLPIPRLVYNGHDVVVDAPTDNRSAVAVLFNGSLLDYASAGDSFDITEFGTMGAYMLSDFAFRSDPTELAIDVFNTGRIAGARNGHRLSEAFGTWGDNDEDYDYLMVVGDIAKEDLLFIGSLPRLTSLHLSPDGMPSENCDNVFANSRIETVYSSAYPAGMLKGMPRLTTVMWGGTDTKMPDGRITEAGNPNILLWVTNTDNAPTDASNLVVFESTDEPAAPGTTDIKGSAKTINLIAGYPYKAHKPIEAESIQLTKEFGQTTDIGYTQGWETITLPFAPDEILRDDNYELVPFNQWPGTDDAPRPFWLYTANGSDWEAADGIEAGVPYIISMPNNPEYIYYYNISGPVRFRAKDVSLGTDDSAPQTVDWIESMRFNATFMPVEEANVLSLNTHGEGGERSGSVFIAEAETLPFGAYVTGATRNNIPVFGTSGIELPSISMNSGIIVTSPAPGTLRISSTRTCSVAVTAITGVTVAKADIKAGETINIEGLATGMYIVAGTKIIVK